MTIQKGDLVQLGNHYLLCGDSTNPEEVKCLLNGKKINLILTDPPYGVDYVESKAGFSQSLAMPKEIINDHLQSEEEYQKFSEKWLKPAAEAMTDKNALYIFNSDKMIFPLREGMKNIGFKFAQLLIWAKTHSVIGRMDYLPQHELIIYGWQGSHKFRKSKDKSLLIHPKPNKSKYHPTMKPIGLLRRLILNSSRIDDIVYDPFGGSGSTLLACEQTKRRCLMIEQDSGYCETILFLWEKMFKKTAIVTKSFYECGKNEIRQS